MRDLFQSCIVVICLITTGCAPGRFAQSPRYTPNLDYTPTKEATPGSADVTFAIVGAEFVAPTTAQQGLLLQQGIPLSSAPAPLLFQQLISNMTKDFEEVLTAKGYLIEGVYRTFDEMNYPNKEGSDLILTAKVKFDVNSNVQYKGSSKFSAFSLMYGGAMIPLLAISYTESVPVIVAGWAGLTVVGIGIRRWNSGVAPSGRVQVVSEVNLEVYEGLTGEIMWSKRIPIPPFDVIPEARFAKHPGEVTWQKLMEIDNKFYSDIGRLFQLQYGKILNQIETYLDPREMAIVKNQAMELRKRKVY